MALSFTSLLRKLRSTLTPGWLARHRRRSRSRGAATLKLRLELLEDRRMLTFGTGGIVTTDIVGGWIEGVALQTDGRIVAAGNGGLARYQTDGSLDLSFNIGGSPPGTIWAGNYQHYFNDVALQADGKIVAGGMKLGAYDLDFLVSRYTAAGVPDTTFGINGEVMLAFQGGTNGTNDEIEALAIQPDGKIVAVGRARNWSKNEWVVMRFMPNGALDTSFDRDGKLTTTFGGKTSNPSPYAVVLRPDGKILVAGTVGHSGTATRDDFALVRYNANGSLDQTFGQGGKVLTDFGSEHGTTYSFDEVRSITLQPDGKIVVGGSSRYVAVRGALARYNANGSLDTTFGGDGKVSPGGPRYDGVSVQADGKIVAGGGALIDRFNPDGSPDTSFDLDGRRSMFLGDSYPEINPIRDLVIQPLDGKILIGGGSGEPQNPALARLNTDGTFDAAAPFTATGSPAANPSVDRFTQEQVQPILGDAIAQWQAGGVDSLPLDKLTVQIVNLADGYLGMADDKNLWLDNNAAGWGWCVDSTPSSSSEFLRLGNRGGSAAAGMDLQTVVMHELGHLLGHDHDEAGVMAETLSVGVRRTDMVHDHMALVDQVFGQPVDQHAATLFGPLLDEQLDSHRLWFNRLR